MIMELPDDKVSEGNQDICGGRVLARVRKEGESQSRTSGVPALVATLTVSLAGATTVSAEKERLLATASVSRHVSIGIHHISTFIYRSTISPRLHLGINLESPSESASDRIVGDSCTTICHDWCVGEPSRRVTVNIMKQSQGMMSLTAFGHRLGVTLRGRIERVRPDTQHDSCSTNCLQPTSAV